MQKQEQPQQQYLMGFWFESEGSWLWARDDYTRETLGYGRLENRLLLSFAIIARAEHLCHWYLTSMPWMFGTQPRPWRQAECDRFKAAARAFFADLFQLYIPLMLFPVSMNGM